MKEEQVCIPHSTTHLEWHNKWLDLREGGQLVGLQESESQIQVLA